MPVCRLHPLIRHHPSLLRGRPQESILPTVHPRKKDSLFREAVFFFMLSASYFR